MFKHNEKVEVRGLDLAFNETWESGTICRPRASETPPGPDWYIVRFFGGDKLCIHETRLVSSMTPTELKAARRALGLSQSGLARALLVASDRTIRRWEAGTQDIPGPAIVAIRLMLESKGLLDSVR